MSLNGYVRQVNTILRVQPGRIVPKFIALAEDDCDDQLLFAEALKQICKQSILHAVSTGMELMELLNTPRTSLPDVIVLDVNMPGMNGIECLKIIRRTDSLAQLPVVVMSTSGSAETVHDAFLHGANSYAVKPGKFSELKAVIEEIVTTDWLSLSPRNRDNFIIRPRLAHH